MSNTLFAAGVALALGIGAQADDAATVSSTVGYLRVTVPGNGGVALLGHSFKRPNGVAPLKVSEVFRGGQLERGDEPLLADAVYVWDSERGEGGGYRTLFQRLDGTFCDAETLTAFDPELATGAAVFVKTRADTGERQLFLTGEVVNEDVQRLAIPAGLSVLANPYAAALDLNHAVAAEWPGATAALVPTLADNVWIWNPSKLGGGGFDVFYLHSGTGGWHRVDAPGAVASDAVIAAGRGAFYSARRPFVNQLTRPYPR